MKKLFLSVTLVILSIAWCGAYALGDRFIEAPQTQSFELLDDEKEHASIDRLAIVGATDHYSLGGADAFRQDSEEFEGNDLDDCDIAIIAAVDKNEYGWRG